MRSQFPRFALFFAVVSIILLTLSFVLQSSPFGAPPANTILPASADTYTYRIQSATNFDGESPEASSGLLIASSDLPTFSDNSQAINRAVFLKFELTPHPEVIESAVLRLASITDGCVGDESDAVEVFVYGIENDAWAERDLMWDDAEANLLTSQSAVFASQTVSQSGYNEWEAGRNSQFVRWLEQERAGDGVATIMLTVESEFSSDVFFEDREGSGTAGGCANVAGSPELELDSSGRPFQFFIPRIGNS